MPHFLAGLLDAPDRAWRLVATPGPRVVATAVEPAFDARTRKVGLLRRERFAAGSALVLAPCNAVHTWFMRFPIDVVFVARDGAVLEVRHAVGPWRIRACLRAFAVVELPAGTAAATGVAPGTALALEDPGRPVVESADEVHPFSRLSS